MKTDNSSLITRHPSLEKLDTFIFDMDGVLVDVSQSYRMAIIQSVDAFFRAGMRLPAADNTPLLTAEDVSLLKNAGGFNNDWDLTTAFIAYFLDLLPPLPISTLPLHRRITTLMAYLEIVSHGKFSVDIDALRAKKDISTLSQQISEHGGGLSALKNISAGHNRHLLFGQGDLKKENLIQRIFQELYLGDKLFAEIYAEKTSVVHTAGLINNETSLIDTATLKDLATRHRLGIATGRPRAEAEYTLNRLEIAPYFEALLTHDDVVSAEAKGKPDPWSLLEIARRMHVVPEACAYIGDTPDDIRAAKAAGFIAIGVLATAAKPDKLRTQFESLGADMVIESPEALKIIFDA